MHIFTNFWKYRENNVSPQGRHATFFGSLFVRYEKKPVKKKKDENFFFLNLSEAFQISYYSVYGSPFTAVKKENEENLKKLKNHKEVIISK